MSSTLLHPALPAAPSGVSGRTARAAAASRGGLLGILTFLLGLTMPFINLDPRAGITTSLLSRIEAVDIICLLIVLLLVFTARIRITWVMLLYGVSLVFSFALATTNSVNLMRSFTPFAALSMAVVYYCVARSIAEHEAAVKALMAGLVVGVLLESVIVVHDYFLPKWFLTAHSDRVRGTFRSTAQLGGYGFTVAGVLFSFGWVYFRTSWARSLVLLAGVMGIFFVLASTRRAGMFALVAWLAIYLLLGLKQISRKSYWIVVGTSMTGLLALVLGSSFIGKTHLAERFNAAYDKVTSGNSFTHEQFYNAMDNLHLWFPLGVGVGQSTLVVGEHEAHNAHLGIAVEQGLLGIVAYYSLWLPFLLRRKQIAPFGQHSVLVKLVLISFLVGALVFMIHARLDRDRVFMLFLGLAPWVACQGLEKIRHQRFARRWGIPAETIPPKTTPPTTMSPATNPSATSPSRPLPEPPLN